MGAFRGFSHGWSGLVLLVRIVVLSAEKGGDVVRKKLWEDE